MAAICPNGHGRQPVIRNLTADMSIPKKAEECIGHVLKCGCTIGGEEYKRYSETVTGINKDEAKELAALKQKFNAKKAAALKALTDTKES